MKLKNWPVGSIAYVILWEEQLGIKLGPSKVIGQSAAYAQLKRVFGERLTTFDTTQIIGCGVSLTPQFPIKPLLARARQEWGSAVVDGEDCFIKNYFEEGIGGGMKFVGFVFWKNDGALIRGKPCLRPPDWDKPVKTLFGTPSFPAVSSQYANNYTATLTDGGVFQIEAYHLYFERGRWVFDRRDQKLKVELTKASSKYYGLGMSPEIAAEDIESIIINEKTEPQ